MDMMEWQPEGTTLVVLGGEWGVAGEAAAGKGGGGGVAAGLGQQIGGSG